MSAPHRGAGRADDPVLLDSSDEEVPAISQAGPSRSRPRPAYLSSRTSLGQSSKAVDLIAESSSDGRSRQQPLFMRKSASPPKSQPSPKSNRQKPLFSPNDLDSRIDLSRDVPIGRSQGRLRKENQGELGSWGNPVQIKPHSLQVPYSSNTEEEPLKLPRPKDKVVKEQPKPLSKPPTSEWAPSVLREQAVPLLQSGSWGNPVQYVPLPPLNDPLNEAEPSSFSSTPAADGTGPGTEPIQVGPTEPSLADALAEITSPQPKAAPALPTHALEGSWANPLSFPLPVASEPLDTLNQEVSTDPWIDPAITSLPLSQSGAPPLGSWGNPESSETAQRLKRAPSPTSPNRDVEALAEPSRKGKMQRIESPVLNEAPAPVSPPLPPKSIRPRWATDRDVSPTPPLNPIKPYYVPATIQTGTLASEKTETAPLGRDKPSANEMLISVSDPQFGTWAGRIFAQVSEQPVVVSDPEGSLEDTNSADVGDMEAHPEEPMLSANVMVSPEISTSVGNDSAASAEIPSMNLLEDNSMDYTELELPGNAAAISIDQDVKPVFRPSFGSPSALGNSGLNPIEYDLNDEDLDFLTSDKEDEATNGPDDKVEKQVELVRIGVDDVEIDDSLEQNKQPSRSVSSTPSIEEIRPEDITQPEAGPSRPLYRARKRVQSEDSDSSSSTAKARALESIRTRRQVKVRQPPSVFSVPSSPEEQRSPSSRKLEVVIPTRSKQQWIKMAQTEAESDVEDILDDADCAPSSGPSIAVDLFEHNGFTVKSTYRIPMKKANVKTPDKRFKNQVVSPDHSALWISFPDPPPPPERVSQANRILNTRLIDEWNRRKPTLTSNPALHRAVFEAYMAQCTSIDEPQADEIRVVNDVDAEGAPPDFEFQYSNSLLYNPEVPDPELGLGCDCEGPCDPKSKTCSCVKRQELYTYDLGMKGFAYDERGHIREDSISVWECGKNCGCPPECMNRVIQRGRSKDTKIELFKTQWKGWGVRARAPIPPGTFLGIYAGELITETESEERGKLYAKLGRTYLFDCDGWQIGHPPAGLAKIDPRAAQLAELAALRAKEATREVDDPGYVYSAYSVDAFHYGFTRYFNHSCDPNLAITQAYVKDFHPERPTLVIFTRRGIRAGEELCISYKGLPEETAMPEPASSRRALGTKRKKNKTSASAHVTGTIKAKVAAKDRCMCKTALCNGRMFNYGND